MTFGDEVGHCVIGNVHTGALLGQLMAQVGRTDEGIDTMSSLIADDEHISMRIVRSQMHLQQGNLQIAEQETQQLLKELPKSQPLIRQLATIRLATRQSNLCCQYSGSWIQQLLRNWLLFSTTSGRAICTSTWPEYI